MAACGWRQSLCINPVQHGAVILGDIARRIAAGVIQRGAKQRHGRLARAPGKAGPRFTEPDEGEGFFVQFGIQIPARIRHKALSGKQRVAGARRHNQAREPLDAGNINRGRIRIEAIGCIQRGRENRHRRSCVIGRILGADFHQTRLGESGDQARRDPRRGNLRGAVRHFCPGPANRNDPVILDDDNSVFDHALRSAGPNRFPANNQCFGERRRSCEAQGSNACE